MKIIAWIMLLVGAAIFGSVLQYNHVPVTPGNVVCVVAALLLIQFGTSLLKKSED